MIPPLLASMSSKYGMKILLIGGTAIAISLGVMHYRGVVSERDLYKTKATLEAEAHLSTKRSFNIYKDQVNAQIADISADLSKLDTKYKEARKEAGALSKKLAKHDLEHLAKKKPDAVTSIINAGTERLFHDIETSTQH